MRNHCPTSTPIWSPHLRRHSPARATGRLTFDVAVVGGGLTGLSAAFHIRKVQPMWRVGVFEAAFTGFGASGRSGGILVAHPALYGSEGDVSFLREFVAKFDIDCDWQSSAGRMIGIDGEYANDVIDPLMLCEELHRLCDHVGVQVFEESAIVEISTDMHEAVGSSFHVSADRFVLATDAFPCPWTPADQLQEVSTQPCLVVRLPATRSNRIPWTYYRDCGDLETYYWGRRIGVAHFLFGGPEAASDQQPVSSQDLLSDLGKLLPDLRDAVPERYWTGEVARFRDGHRRIVSWGLNAFFVGGYEGYGIAAAVRSGAMLTDLLVSGLQHSEFPVQDMSGRR